MSRIISALLIAGLGLGLAIGEEQSTDLKADQVPAPVMATMVKAANGGKLSEFEQEVKNGKTVFTAEVKDAAGKVNEITVSPDGTLVSVAPEEEEKNGDKDEEKGDKGHGHHD